MIAIAACFLCSALLGVRLVSLIGFIPALLLAALAAMVMEGPLFSVLVLVVMQIGYFSGLLTRAGVPVGTVRPVRHQTSPRGRIPSH